MTSPAVSLLLLAYEQARFVREAAEAALAQEGVDLEVILSDDASRDDTFEILEDVARRYKGPHCVILNRSRENLGHGHLNELVSMARGDLLVVAHGDDVSLPTRARTLLATWREHHSALISSNATMIDGHGKVLGRVAADEASHGISTSEIVDGGWQKTLLGATFAFHRSLFDRFGGLPVDTLPRRSGDDHLLPFRASLLSGARYLAEPLVAYRVHGGQGTNFLCDKLGSDDAYDETYAAFSLATLVAMRDSALHLQERVGASEATRDALLRIDARIVEEAGRWARLRSRLTRAGKQPRWLDERPEQGARAAARKPLVPGRPHPRFHWRRLLRREPI